MDFTRFFHDGPFRLIEPLIKRGGAFYQSAGVSEPGEFSLDFRQFACAKRGFFQFFHLKAQKISPLGALAHTLFVDPEFFLSGFQIAHEFAQCGSFPACLSEIIQ